MWHLNLGNKGENEHKIIEKMYKKQETKFLVWVVYQIIFWEF